MNLNELINKINKCTDELDFVSARKYIENNINGLEGYKQLLNSNARELYDFITKRLQDGFEPLSRQEKATIHTINVYANKFDVRGIKVSIKNHSQLFLRKDLREYLNKDAVTVLEGLGVLEKIDN